MISLTEELVIDSQIHHYFGDRASWSGNCLLWIGPTALPTAFQTDLRLAFGLTGGRVVPVSLRRLSAELLEEIEPNGVISTLFWSGGDALDAARELSGLGYRGRYRAVSPALPDASVIVREIRSLYPEIDFAIMEFPPGKAASERGAR